MEKDIKETTLELPKKPIYKLSHYFIIILVFLLCSTCIAYSVLLVTKYYNLLFNNKLHEVVSGHMKNNDGTLINWTVSVPTSLLGRYTALFSFLSSILFGILLLFLFLYMIYMNGFIITPYLYLFLFILSTSFGIFSVFLLYIVNNLRKITGQQDCPIQQILSNDCSTALANNEVYSYQVCKVLDVFCVNEYMNMVKLYVVILICVSLSFMVSPFSIFNLYLMYKCKAQVKAKESAKTNNKEETIELGTLKQYKPGFNRNSIESYYLPRSFYSNYPYNCGININANHPILCIPPNLNHGIVISPGYNAINSNGTQCIFNNHNQEICQNHDNHNHDYHNHHVHHQLMCNMK